MKKGLAFILLLLLTNLTYAQEWVMLQGDSHPNNPSIELSTGNSGNMLAQVKLDGFWQTQISTPEGMMSRIGTADGSAQTLTGFPDVEHLTLSLLIPEKGNYKVTVVHADYTDFSDIPVAPSKGDPQYSDQPGWGTFTFDESIRESDAFYPAHIAEADQPYIWCDSRGMAIQVYPFAYNPVSGVLRVYHDITIELERIEGVGINEISRYSGSYGRESRLSSLKKGHFLNYSENNRYAPVAETGQMLIVAPEEFRATLQPFMDWKTRCGMVCEFVNVASVPTAEQIRQLVSERYYDKGLTYLLLAGDVAQVPSNHAEYGASDNMYGYVAGDDHYPEVLVGRFSAETTRQLAIIVERTLNYEMYGKGNSGYSNFLAIAGEEGPGDNGEMDFEHLRNIGKVLKSYNYKGFTELYDGSQGENDANGNPTAAMVEAAVNSGQGVIMYGGHGASGKWATSNFTGENIARLTNTETHPFIWSAGCSTGDFTTTTCLAEKWIRAEKDGVPTGAIAVMMSSGRQSWFPPMAAQDEMALILAKQKEEVSSRTFGGISMSGCMKMNDKYGILGYKVTDTWNVFGDPSVIIRTAMPAEISAYHAERLGADAGEFAVRIAAPDAMACLTYNGKLIGAARAQDGIATFPLNELPESGSLQLTITAYNHLPYMAEIEITELPATACNPTPINFAGKISPYTTLSWDVKDGMSPSFFEVVISENQDMRNPVASLVTFETSTTPELPLDYAHTYFWKVISHNQTGTTESRVFTFTTINPPDEDFESQGFPRNNWSNTGDNAWFIDANTSFEGRYSLRSGEIDHNGESRLAYSCYTASCDFLGFRLKISSQQNADVLSLIIDGITLATYSGEADWLEEQIVIEAGEHLIEWVYTKDDNSISGADAAWIDNIYLPGNGLPAVVLEDVETCPGHPVDLRIEATGSSHVEWLTDGSGWFDDINSHYPIYNPTQEDLNRGFVLLFAEVFSNDFCPPARHELTLTFMTLPELPVINDTILYSGEEMEIILPVSFTAGYKLLPVGEEGSRFVVKADDLNEGENILTISCENEAGCSAEQYFTVMVIKGTRPTADKELFIYPNPASTNISIATSITCNGQINVRMFNISGQLVLQMDKWNGMGETLDVSVLPEGIYMVQMENGKEIQNGRFIKTM